MKTATFNPNGGPIIAEVTPGSAAVGSYTILLWEANANLVVMRRDGNFINTADDAYTLPEPNEHNDGRIVECIATVVITPPVDTYNVDLVIRQDGNEIGGDSASGSDASGTVTVDLFVQLNGGGA
ncbi:hypothetical protein [Longimicrobium sp.]|jgi:hypothetical protein|uniref:hypothetical protein n=1 Tax=Longimicrobium sp. TaxID=2029185 RepID=UPI002ED9EF1C